MMPIPGTFVTVTSASTPNSTAANPGALFAIGQTYRGAVGVGTSINSLPQFIAMFGARTSNGATPTLYDSLDAFFTEGGQQAYISRVSGANAVTATHTLVDRAATTPVATLAINAMGPGTWGDVITVAVANGSVANSYVLTITNGTVTEISPNLFAPVDAVNWAASYSATVTIANLGSATVAPNNNPAVVAATALTGGVDDTSPADSVWVNALAAFSADLGDGQVAAPGRTTPVVWEGLVNHAQANNRFALLDGENLPTASQIEADANTVSNSVVDPSYGFMLAPWPIYPGAPTGTATPAYPRTIAPSGAIAGVMARLAATGVNADVAAAGVNGILRGAVSITQTYVPSDRALLDAAGVAVIRNYRSNIQLYGFTTLALDPNWSDAGNVRLRMEIIDNCSRIGDGYDFGDIDAKGQVAAALGGQISAYLNRLFSAGALYGTTAADAFFVNTGPSINTPTTAQARQLLAQIGVRMSPTAEQVLITITRYPVTQTLPV